MNPRGEELVITGLGPVTSIGVGGESMWASLAAGRANVQPRVLPVDIAVTAELPVASMPPHAEIEGLEPHLETLVEQECDPYRDLAYTLLAIELALADAKLEVDRGSNRIGVVQAFEAPGVEGAVSQLFRLMGGPLSTDGPPRLYDRLAQFFYSMQPFLYVHVVGKAFGLHGFSTSVHNACSSGAFALEVAAEQIRRGQAEAMIVAGGEAFDTAVRLEWFRRLELYAHDGQMRPFDPESSGFYVGEGAGAFVLESASHAAGRGVEPYAVYLGGAYAQQSWKQTIPDLRAGRLRDVITHAMVKASVEAGDLDLVIPHGASTLLCDGYEASCLAESLDGEAGQTVATVFKPYVGHMLATSGIIETICALLALRHQHIPATLRTRPGKAKLPIPLVTTSVDRPLNTVLKLSTGFTGHDAASLFRRP